MTASSDLSPSIAAAKQRVAERRAASPAPGDRELRILRKALKRMQRRRRAVLARQAQLAAKSAKKAAAEAAG